MIPKTAHHYRFLPWFQKLPTIIDSYHYSKNSPPLSIPTMIPANIIRVQCPQSVHIDWWLPWIRLHHPLPHINPIQTWVGRVSLKIITWSSHDFALPSRDPPLCQPWWCPWGTEWWSGSRGWWTTPPHLVLTGPRDNPWRHEDLIHTTNTKIYKYMTTCVSSLSKTAY